MPLLHAGTIADLARMPFYRTLPYLLTCSMASPKISGELTI